MRSTGFGKLFECLKKEMVNNNDILISAIREDRRNDEWYNRMESNLSIIFGGKIIARKKTGFIERILKGSCLNKWQLYVVIRRFY
jgi:hypothetical protein